MQLSKILGIHLARPHEIRPNNYRREGMERSGGSRNTAEFTKWKLKDWLPYGNQDKVV